MKAAAVSAAPVTVLRAHVQPFDTAADEARGAGLDRRRPDRTPRGVVARHAGFFAARASLTRKLIEQKDFAALAVKSDWPDAHRVNRFVHGQADLTAHTALAGFERFPTWVGLGFARRAQARSTRVGRQFRAALSRSPSTAFFCRSNQIPGFMKRCARPDSNARSG